jgi:lipopolysaccharide transport system ATP-binding protein
LTIRQRLRQAVKSLREPSEEELGSRFALGDQPTVIHVTHHKAGSQWVYAVLQGVAPGRLVLPQPDYTHFLLQPILPGMVYPTVYVTREQYESVDLPRRHKTFAIIRDLRDTLISTYFSFKDTHPLMHTPADRRRGELKARSVADGFRLIMKTSLSRVERVQLSWIDSYVPLFRYEELIADSIGSFRRILEHCEFDVSSAILQKIVSDASFENVSGRQLGQVSGASHLRRGAPGGWRELLTGKILAEFKERFDQTLIDTGYEKDDSWGKELLDGAVFAPSTGWPVIAPEANPCVCGNARLEPFSPEYDRCPRCGTLVCRVDLRRRAPFGDFVSTSGSPEAWLSSINAAEGSGDALDSARRLAVAGLWTDEHVAALETLLAKVPAPARVLQMGVHEVALCELLKNAGYQPILLQPSDWFAENASREFDIDVRNGRLEDQGFEDGSIGAVVLTEKIISGFDHPAAMLREVRRLLGDQGLLLISERFPQLEGSYAEIRARGSEALKWLRPKSHRFVLTKEGLGLVLAEAGFTTVEMKPMKQLYPPWWDRFERWNQVTASGAPIPDVAGAGHAALLSTPSGRLVAAVMAARREIRMLFERREEDRALAFEQLQKVSWSRVEAGTSGDMVEFGAGWYEPEVYEGESFRWASSPALLSVVAASGEERRLTLRLEPGPGIDGPEMELQLCANDGEPLASHTVRGRETVSFEVPQNGPRTTSLQLVAPAGGRRVEGDPRILDFRVFDLHLD